MTGGDERRAGRRRGAGGRDGGARHGGDRAGASFDRSFGALAELAHRGATVSAAVLDLDSGEGVRDGTRPAARVQRLQTAGRQRQRKGEQEGAFHATMFTRRSGTTMTLRGELFAEDGSAHVAGVVDGALGDATLAARLGADLLDRAPPAVRSLFAG